MFHVNLPERTSTSSFVFATDVRLNTAPNTATDVRSLGLRHVPRRGGPSEAME